MWTDKFALVCALLVLSILEAETARRGGPLRLGLLTYPKSTGVSGAHSYPSVPDGSRAYPGTYSGLSGRSGHGYPKSGGGHTYPSSQGHHTYPSSQRLFRNGSRDSFTHYSHYYYSPPKGIRYTTVNGGIPIIYPVYHGSLPTYVYQYKNSESKYSTLLTGLALLNLGAIATGTAAYATGNRDSNSDYGYYRPQPGEYCEFGVKQDSGNYEEVGIDCQLITSFIIQADQTQSGRTNKTVVPTTVINVTSVNRTNYSASENPPSNTTETGNVLYQVMPDGTLLPVNVTANANGIKSEVTTVTTNTTIPPNALGVKGKPIAVTPGMQCFLIRHTPFSDFRKGVPCGLLQAYAETVTDSSAARANASEGNGDGNYKPQPGEFCKFGFKKDNGDFEETRIDCKLIVSVILEADLAQTQSEGANKTIARISVTNFITLNLMNGVASDHPPMNTTKVENNLYQKMPDGTFLPVNVTTVTTNTTTVTDALDVKGTPIADTPGMQCFVIRHTPVSDMRKTVPCHLLETLSDQSLQSNSAAGDDASALP